MIFSSSGNFNSYCSTCCVFEFKSVVRFFLDGTIYYFPHNTKRYFYAFGTYFDICSTAKLRAAHEPA